MTNPHDQLDEEWRNAIDRDDLRDERRHKRAEAAAGTSRYLIVQESSGRWVIACACDNELGWTGQHWTGRDQAARLMRFADQAAAEQYAREVFGQSMSDYGAARPMQTGGKL